MNIVDSHAHLEGPPFDDDRAAMLDRARAAGVTALLAIGAGTPPTERLDAAISFAEQYDWIYATIGIHPHDAGAAGEDHYVRLDELARHPRVIAWGEIGLDYHYDASPTAVPHAIQQEVFRRQLEQASAAKLPVVIHCRDAWDDCLALLERHWRRTALGGIFHCFTGSLPEARRGLDMGFLISFAGNVTYPKMQPLRDVARAIPLEKILTETDSPFLSPQGRRGKRNEPAFVVEVAQTLANVRNLAADEVASATASNFCRLFGLSTADSGRAW